MQYTGPGFAAHHHGGAQTLPVLDLLVAGSAADVSKEVNPSMWCRAKTIDLVDNEIIQVE